MEQLKTADLRISKIVFAAGFLCTGLFTDAAACLFSALYAGIFCLLIIKRKEQGVRLHRGGSLLLLLLPLCYLAVTVWAIDRGMSLIGFGRMAGLFFWTLILMQYSREEKASVLALIPDLISLLVLFAIPAALPALSESFYVAGRYGATLQYPNTFAVLCIAGLVLQGLPECREKICFGRGADMGKRGRLLRGGQTILLMAGVFASGSRFGFLLLAAAVVLLLIFEREQGRQLLLSMLLLAAAAFTYAAVTGSSGSIGRFLTISPGESTFLGRLLYWKDGLRILKEHPFGMGYLGYYYMEPVMQTGYYSVRMIHNDLLQLALDLGILPGVLLAAAYVWKIFQRGLQIRLRLLLILMGLHFLVDFDLSFLAVWYLLILCLMLDAGGKEERTTAGRKVLMTGAGAVCVFTLWLGASPLPAAFGDTSLTARLLPFDTEARKQVLVRETDVSAAETLAEEILEQNPYISAAWEVRSLAAFQRREYIDMVSFGKEALYLQKYEIRAYEDYLDLLSQAVSQAAQSGTEEEIYSLLKAVSEVPGLLRETEEKTDPLAWKIADVPNLKLPEEYQDYVARTEEILSPLKSQ